MSGSTWPEERLAVLVRMWGEGYSQGDIAEELGVTRNMVAGQIRTLKISRANTALLDKEQAERKRLARMEDERLERERETQRIAGLLRKSGNSKTCLTDGCIGPKQPGHKFGLCSTCDQKRLARRVAA